MHNSRFHATDTGSVVAAAAAAAAVDDDDVDDHNDDDDDDDILICSLRVEGDRSYAFVFSAFSMCAGIPAVSFC
jgi:hypothetical protein